MKLTPALLLIALIATGCGGAGALNTTTTTQDQIIGPFQTRATSGKPQTVTQSLGTATVTGVAGVAFSKITYQPAPNAANSRLLFGRSNGSARCQLYISTNDGSIHRDLPGP